MNRTIFIADDDKLILEMYTELFKMVNTELDSEDEFTIKLFEDGSDLVSTLKDYYHNHKKIPLCILDIRMRKMGGFETSKKIRLIDPHIIILFITGYSERISQELRDTLIHNFYYIKKPFTEEEILSLVDSLLKCWNKSEELIKLNLILSDKESELKNSREKFRRFAENLGKEYFFYTKDTERKYTYISDSIKKILGYTKEDYQKNSRKYFTDNSLNKLAQHFTKLCIEGKQQPAFNVEIIHKSGKIIPLEIFEYPVYNEAKEVVAIEGMARHIL